MLALRAQQRQGSLGFNAGELDCQESLFLFLAKDCKIP